MIDAYTIGITLALEDGVSAGIAAIRQDLAALDRAVANSAAGLVALRRLGQQASLVTRDDLLPTPPSAALAARPALGSAAPTPNRTSPANGTPSDPVSDVPEVKPPAGRRMLQRPMAPLVDVPRQSVLPTQPAGTRTSAAPSADRVLTTKPDGIRPGPIAEFASVAPSTPFPAAPKPPQGQPSAQAAALAGATSLAPAAPVLVATGSPRIDVPAPLPDSRVAPRAPRLPRVQAPPKWSDYAVSTHGRSDRVDLSSRARPDAPLAQTPSGHAPVSPAPAADSPPEQAGSAPRRARVDRLSRELAASDTEADTTRQMVPSSPSEASSAGFSGQIILEGSRLGRWMTDGLTRMTERPPSGSTGIDPRVTPGWPGLHGD